MGSSMQFRDRLHMTMPPTSTFPYTLTLPTSAAMHEFGHHLGQVLPVGSVLLLEGDLGSGKTTLVQGIGAGLGITDAIDSPTFTLINEYFDGRSPLYHLDLYRLEPAEVAALMLETYWEGVEVEAGIVAIEWAERLQRQPRDYLRLHLTHAEPEGRQITLTPVGAFDPALLAGLG